MEVFCWRVRFFRSLCEQEGSAPSRRAIIPIRAGVPERRSGLEAVRQTLHSARESRPGVNAKVGPPSCRQLTRRLQRFPACPLRHARSRGLQFPWRDELLIEVPGAVYPLP